MMNGRAAASHFLARARSVMLNVLRKSFALAPFAAPVLASHSCRNDAAEQPLRTLLTPLVRLLTGGGDARLVFDPIDGLDKYGCRPTPPSEVVTFASSTASSISRRGYLRADRARRDLIQAALNIGLTRAFDLRIEQLRRELKVHLELNNSATEVVFSPSGTDSQLHALFIARSLLGSDLVSIVVGADETGSGTAQTAGGRHFAWCTARGNVVQKGAPLPGLATDRPSIEVALRDARGGVRPTYVIDNEIIDAITRTIGDGRSVLLHVMDHSKSGLRAPSSECLSEISRRWPNAVQVVVDACQMRLGRARIRDYLNRGYMVLLTGSKFFTGAPFSGALLVPGRLSETLSAVDNVPRSLHDYSNRSDWPPSWGGIRSNLPARMNFGQWLRWEAALEEISNYFAVPASFRMTAFQNFSSAIRRLIDCSPSLQLIPGQIRDASDIIDDEEMSVRTIWPFVIRRQGKAFPPDVSVQLYRALNKDVSNRLPSIATLHERRLAAQLCHIGQPVAIHDCDGSETAVLRISIGARMVSESWSTNESAANANLAREIDGIATTFEKLEMLITYSDAMDFRERPSEQRMVFHGENMTEMTSVKLMSPQDVRSERIGIAKLSKMAFDGTDLGPLWNDLLKEVAEGVSDAAAVMDMSVITQLLGDQKSGLALQAGALEIERVYRLPCSVLEPRLRVLALVAAVDIGGNTPIEFLLDGSDVELCTLYIVPGKPLPDPLPAHDIAFVAVPDLDETKTVLAEVDRLIATWPRPVLNLPQRIFALNRDRLFDLLKSLPGLKIPNTSRVSRARLSEIGLKTASLRESLEDGRFPLIVRPVDSHAGRGLAKLERLVDIGEYLQQWQEEDFFISRYVDYRSEDGLFRKYRIVLVDGRPYACHMAISDQWKIWYLNAEMAASATKRAEEEHFMATFDDAFVKRHGATLSEMVKRVGLEYFAIDCAETMGGELLVFEGDNTMIVHNMDPPHTFPYKAPQMNKIFQAFTTMLRTYSNQPRACA